MSVCWLVVRLVCHNFLKVTYTAMLLSLLSSPNILIAIRQKLRLGPLLVMIVLLVVVRVKMVVWVVKVLLLQSELVVEVVEGG